MRNAKALAGLLLAGWLVSACAASPADSVPRVDALMGQVGTTDQDVLDAKILAIMTSVFVYSAHRPEQDRGFTMAAYGLCGRAKQAATDPFGDAQATVMRRTAIWVAYRDIAAMLVTYGEKTLVRVTSLVAGGVPSAMDIRRIAEKGSLATAVIADIHERMDMVRDGTLDAETAKAEFTAELARACRILGDRAGVDPTAAG